MVYGLATRGDDKQELVSYLENRNIETRDLLPLTNQPVYRKLFGDDFEDRFPVAKWVNHHGFYIGCHPYMTDDEVEFVISAFTDFYSGTTVAQRGRRTCLGIRTVSILWPVDRQSPSFLNASSL